MQRFINDYEQTPLDAVIYLTGECNYGGRVTDEHDRRLLLSLLDTFLCEAVITEDNYAFSPSGKYFAPKNGTHDTYMEYIKSLPLNADPEVCTLTTSLNRCQGKLQLINRNNAVKVIHLFSLIKINIVLGCQKVTAVFQLIRGK